ncbi:Wzz/FepE/Etk N-terminal domain-containing protein [Omnitrophica bacterium]|nr:Wzz/FepE/Etk N-terminal domain-containing protein [Candidatus Omnitrophota bacterium]
MESSISKKPIDYVKMIFRRKWLIIIPTVIGITVGIIAANVLPKAYEASTLILIEEGRVINPLVKGLAVSTSVADRLNVLREQILGWDRMNQLISKLGLAKDVKTQQDFENLVYTLRRNIIVRLRGQNIVGISFQGRDPVESMNIVKTITDIFIAENLKQQNRETENAIAFINDQLGLYQKQLKQSEIAAMEDRLDTLLLDSTDKHPMVIELRKKMAAAQADMERGNYEVSGAADSEGAAEIQSIKEELKGIREDLATSSLDASRGGVNRTKLAANANDKLYKLLLIERIEKVTAQDAGVNQRLYNELLQRLETAKITQRLEASKDGTRYTILDPARLPLRPVKPNKMLVLLFAAFAGMCGGIALVFAVEIFDHSFLGIDQAKEHLELPILGAISKIITEADVRAQKLRNIKITWASILVSIVLFVAIIFNVILGS